MVCSSGAVVSELVIQKEKERKDTLFVYFFSKISLMFVIFIYCLFKVLVFKTPNPKNSSYLFETQCSRSHTLAHTQIKGGSTSSNSRLDLNKQWKQIINQLEETILWTLCNQLNTISSSIILFSNQTISISKSLLPNKVILPTWLLSQEKNSLIIVILFLQLLKEWLASQIKKIAMQAQINQKVQRMVIISWIINNNSRFSCKSNNNNFNLRRCPNIIRQALKSLQRPSQQKNLKILSKLS